MRAKDLFHKVFTGIHRMLFNATKGRVGGRMLGMQVADLVTTGRKSGQERRTMLTVPIAEDDRLVLVASFGGDERHPAWYRNLSANPQVRITMAGSTRTMEARTASEAERAELWPRIVSVYKGYEDYQRNTDRTIPVVILEPR